MFFVRYERDKKNVEINFKYTISETHQRDFNLNRTLNEPICKTFDKLSMNIVKQITIRQKRKVKKIKNESGGQTNSVNNINNDDDDDNDEVNINIELFNENDEKISIDTLNEIAWKNGYKLKINDHVYNVTVDMPSIKKLSLPKEIFVNVPILAIFDKEEKNIDKFKFSWFISTKELNKNEWELYCEGVNKRWIILDKKYTFRHLKLICVPSDGERDGLPVEIISSQPIEKHFELEELPMSDRHKLTVDKLTGNNLRVVTYNILAKTYCDTAAAKTSFYPYCPVEYLDAKYRRPIILHEILNYNADILFLQETDEDFFDYDLKCYLSDYTGYLKIKGDSREGEAIFFRKDRFKHIKNYDIRITDEIITNKLYKELWENICKYDEEMKELIVNRNTMLQCILVESIENPGNFVLLANTHLFFHPKADFIRLIQAVVSIKHIESILDNLVSVEKKNTALLFAGDFNSDVESYAIQYLFTQQLPLHDLNEFQKKLIDNLKDLLIHSLNLTTYADFKYSNYMATFNCLLDYIFYEQNQFNLKRVIPMPTHEQVIENVGLPSKKIPSDHLPIILELEWKLNENKN